MRVYEIEITLESPLVSTEEQIGNILRHSGAYIKGRLIRGAILNLLRSRHPDEVKDEIEKPKLIFHPAYPFDGEIYKPAHPFVFRCKICKEMPSPDWTEKYKEIYDIVKSLKDGKFQRPICCKKGHPFSLESSGGALVKNNSEKFTVRHVRVESVGINRAVKSSEVGMLYGYVALPPGLSFKGLIVDIGSRIEGIAEIKEIWMGRGISRGMGKASVKIREVDGKLDERKKEIKGVIERKGILILRALSQIFSLKLGLNGIYSIPLPSLNHKAISPVRIDAFNGNGIFTGFSGVLGFSSLSRLPIPRITGADIGSIFIYEVSADQVDDAAEYLARGELLGFGPFSASGFNILEVMR